MASDLQSRTLPLALKPLAGTGHRLLLSARIVKPKITAATCELNGDGMSCKRLLDVLYPTLLLVAKQAPYQRTAFTMQTYVSTRVESASPGEAGQLALGEQEDEVRVKMSLSFGKTGVTFSEVTKNLIVTSTMDAKSTRPRVDLLSMVDSGNRAIEPARGKGRLPSKFCPFTPGWGLLS